MLDILLNEYKTKIDARLDILVSENGQRYDEVVRAARYSLLSGGKRIRPIILLEFYRLCGGEGDLAYNFACALEMIHTYSLIHDDLPCMDNDDFRRGKPSCHKEFGETTALLAGDALLTEAFGAAAKTVGINAENVTSAIATLSGCAGIAGMVGGQVMDIAGEQCLSDEAGILEMYRLKTGALIKAAAVCGAMLAGADEEEITASAVYGEKLGLAFQLVDDILDHEGDEAVLGKPIGSDEKNDKYTLLGVLGIERCRELAKQYTDEAHTALGCFMGDTSNLRELTDYLLVRNY